MTSREYELMKEIEILSERLTSAEKREENLMQALAELEGSKFYVK